MKLWACDRILVVKPSSLGDIIHTLPAVEAIHREAPKAKIDWVVNTEWVPLLAGVPFISRIIPFPRQQFKGLAGGLRARNWANQKLQPRNYDLALDFQGLFRSAFLARKAKPKRLMGFKQSREGAAAFYDQKVSVINWSGRHAVERNLDLAAAAGANIANPRFILPEGEMVPDLTYLPHRTVILHPFSRGQGKSLSPTEVNELCEQLKPLSVILVGMPPDDLICEWPSNVTDLLGKTSLSQLIYLIRNSAWNISVDSGPMHLAAGITSHVLSLHTWSNPAMVGPWSSEAWVWRDGQLTQVKSLTPSQFPEQRELKKKLAKQARLYSEEDINAIASFVSAQIIK